MPIPDYLNVLSNFMDNLEGLKIMDRKDFKFISGWIEKDSTVNA